MSQWQHGSHEEQTRPKQVEARVIVFIIQETDAKISPTHVSRRGWREEEGGGMRERVGLKGEEGGMQWTEEVQAVPPPKC